MINLLKNLLNKGHSRTVRAKKNILLSFIFQGSSMALSLVIVPVTLSVLTNTEYGIWLTMTSITAWFRFMDVGLEQGLRNKFTESVAKNELTNARIYVSTTYAWVILIMAVFMGGFVVANQFIDWTKILNTGASFSLELKIISFIVFGEFALQFIFKLVITILTAKQKPAIRDLALLISKLITLGGLFLFIKLEIERPLVYITLLFSGSYLLVLIVVSLIYFNGSLKIFRPSIKFIKFKYSKELMKLGYQFFILQVSVIVLLTTDNFIITQLFEPAEVTPYHIARRYFELAITAFVIIITPFWSATTDAFHKNDFKWIRDTMKKLLKIYFGFVLITIIMLLFSKTAYQLWVGDKVSISFSLSIAMAVFVVFHLFSTLYIYFINGFGKLRVSLFSAVFSIIFNIPLSIFFGKTLNMGLPGIILATTVSAILSSILIPIQFYKILNHKAKGIWMK